MRAVHKILSSNDLSLTGSHQGGICVPKSIVDLDFFPRLNSSEYNPRLVLPIKYAGTVFNFTFIYYNNRLHGRGTRNEYRLTGMTKFFRISSCKVGDTLKFIRDKGSYKIEIIRKDISPEEDFEEKEKPLVIRANWYFDMED